MLVPAGGADGFAINDDDREVVGVVAGLARAHGVLLLLMRE